MLTKKWVINIIGYAVVLSVGIILGMTINEIIPQKQVQGRETAAENSEAVKETLPPVMDSRAYYLKIEDGAVKQYRKENDVLIYEKDLTYIDINSLDTEFADILSNGIMFADSVALAEFIENLDS